MLNVFFHSCLFSAWVTSCLVLMPVDPSLTGKAVVLISVTDVNDNPPSLADDYDTFVCENAEPGQVRTIKDLGPGPVTPELQPPPS